jgi:hypothetical protein
VIDPANLTSSVNNNNSMQSNQSHTDAPSQEQTESEEENEENESSESGERSVESGSYEDEYQNEGNLDGRTLGTIFFLSILFGV